MSTGSLKREPVGSLRAALLVPRLQSKTLLILCRGETEGYPEAALPVAEVAEFIGGKERWGLGESVKLQKFV